MQVCQGTDTARSNQWARRGTPHFPQGGEIWSAERTITCYIRVNKALYANSTQFSGECRRPHTRRFTPSRDSNPTISCIQPYYDALVPACKRFLQQRSVSECYGTKYDPIHPRVKYLLDMR